MPFRSANWAAKANPSAIENVQPVAINRSLAVFPKPHSVAQSLIAAAEGAE